MGLRHIVPVVAAAGIASASICSIAGTTTISSAAQATALSSCTTFAGSIAIAEDTTDQIVFTDIQQITGSLIANNVSQLTSLEADGLATIGGTFELNDCPALSSLTFPDLTNVANIRWIGLAQLQGLSFSTGVQMAQTVYIENTQLGSLDGINLQMVVGMYLANNPYLQTINMQLTNITEQFTVAANGRDVQLSLPNLISANSLSIRNVSSISLPSLSSVNGSFGFYSNFVESLSCPNLTSIGSTLAIDDNAELTMLNFPELKSVGGALQVQNNTQFANATGFQKVQTVGGAVSMYGAFTSVPLPALTRVSGAFYIVSSSNSTAITSECSHYKSIQGSNNVIQGSGFNCIANVDGAATDTNSTAPTTTGSSSATSTSKSSANTLLISGTTCVLGVVAALFGLL